MKTIYLSPHLDDAVFSCGGWIWEQTCRGKQVEIWTICAGDPPEGPLSALADILHQSWGLGREAVQIRREEDRQACSLLGAESRYFSYRDCIYRTDPGGDAYYQVVEDLFGGLDPRESDLIDAVSGELADTLPPGAELIVPLSIGNHVDHELVRKAASRLDRPTLYYADYPYAREEEGKHILEFMGESPDWKVDELEITEEGMDKWVQSALQYGSQISTFWDDSAHLKAEIRQFYDNLGGFKLWETSED